MSIYYEYDQTLWIRDNAKGGNVRLFGLGGKRKGERFIVGKEKFSTFNKLSSDKDGKKIGEYLEVKVNKTTTEILKQLKEVTIK